MGKNLALLLILFCSNIFACECIPFSPVSKEVCDDYDVVFFGRVDSVGSCNDKGFAIAYFTITELYKGNAAKHVEINFDCSSECLMSFAEGEAWIIYSMFEKFDNLKISICGHSRKKFDDETQDIYLLAAKRTFENELEFLKTTLGVQTIVQPVILNNTVTETGRHNDQPSNWGKVLLLLISATVMAIVYIITRKKK